MKRFLILLLLAGIIAAGFFGYRHFYQPVPVNAWSLVPESALIVYESDQFYQTWGELKEKKVWKTFSNVEAISQFTESLNALDSMENGKSLMELLTKNNKLLISLFPINKSELDALYVIELKSLEQHAAISNIFEKDYNRDTRKYSGFTISDIVHKNTGKKFSYIFYKNYLIASRTPFLVEDAIRTIDDATYLSFQEARPSLFSLAQLQQDDGNIYFNTARTGELADLFYRGKRSELAFLNRLISTSFLDIAVSESNVSLNGFSLSGTEEEYLSIFKNNPASGFTISNLVSNDAFALQHLSFTDAASFLAGLETYRKTYDGGFQKGQAELAKYDIDPASFAEWMADEVAAYSANKGQTRIFTMKTKDLTLANRQLKEIAERVANANADSLYSEVYDGNEISFFPLSDFPSLVFGEMAAGFEDVFYISYDQWLVFSNDLQEIKNLIEDMKNENTWGKSLKFNQFMELVNKESNVSYIVNVKNAWGKLLELLNDDWEKFFSNNASILQEYELVGAQFSSVDDKFFTNLSILHPGDYTKKRGSRSLQSEISINFDHPLTSKPKVVTNHANNSKEIILQDSSNKVYLLSSNFDILWVDSLRGQLTSPVHQVDYYKNGKLQYLFATGDWINLIDRKGQTTADYPIDMGDVSINTLNVVDYNKTKKYRWALSSNNGELYLLDKKGKKLNKWAPHRKRYKIKRGIRHTRIVGKDLMLVCQQEGIIDILNRQGNSYPGFPLNFEKDIDDEFILKPGTSFNKSSATFIARDGEILSVNLRGKFLRREQLIHGSTNSVYGIVKDLTSDNFVISVIDDRKIILLDSEGEKKFEKNYLNNGDLLLQYYNFGPGNELIIVTDLMQEFTYLYDGNGNLINSIPIENSHEVSILYSRSNNEFELFTSYGSRLDKYRFKLR